MFKNLNDFCKKKVLLATFCDLELLFLDQTIKCGGGTNRLTIIIAEIQGFLQ